MRKSFVLFLLFAALLVLLDACSTQKQAIKEKVSPVAIAPLQPGLLFDHPLPRLASGLPLRRLVQTERMPLYYHQAYAMLEAMLEGREMPDFEKAVFVSENAYYDNRFTLVGFRYAIDQHQFFVQALAAANDKSDSIDFNVKVNQYGRFNLGDIRFLPGEKKELYKKAIVNWAIFTYITDTTAIAPFYHLPFTYATQDPFGIKDWANSQVMNLLGSREQKGNCFALTALFKILSDRLGSESRLCTAPQHIYIQHRDNKGDYYNVELATAGHPGDGTIQTLTHTTTGAIRSGIALRSYDAKQGVGLCLVNLAKSYEHKFQTKGDAFMLKCAELALKHDSLNLNALLLKQQILDTWVTAFAKTKQINDIHRLKTDRESCNAVIALEQHLALLYRLGYREMPLDMQEIIMTGVYPENFEDKNPGPFTSIDPKDPHRKKFQTLYGGLFQEVFETRKYEPYGHFTLKTTSNKISGMDTTAKTGFLIDPVAFAYDFGARIYDARLGRWLSTDPLQAKYPGFSPYNFVANNPVIFVDADGREIILSNHAQASRYAPVVKLINDNIAASSFAKKYISPFNGPRTERNLYLGYHNLVNSGEAKNGEDTKAVTDRYFLEDAKGVPSRQINFNSATVNVLIEYSGSDLVYSQMGSIGMALTYYHEVLHANGLGHDDIAKEGVRKELVSALLDFAKLSGERISRPDAEYLSWIGLDGTAEYTTKFGTNMNRNAAQVIEVGKLNKAIELFQGPIKTLDSNDTESINKEENTIVTDEKF